MFKIDLVFTVALLFLLTACNPSSTIVLKEAPNKVVQPLSKSTISQIAIPVRENGYSHFETQVISSHQALSSFLKELKLQDGWNQRKNFLESLEIANIDFSKENLLLYRITEASGSTVLAVDKPTGDAKHILIKIGRDKPQTNTSDMAYYTLAYKIAKSVEDVTFDNGIKKRTIKNNHIKPTERKVPKNCMEWFDGCNNCGRVGEEGVPVCTERECYIRGKFKCTKYKETPKQQKLDDAPKHHDNVPDLPHSQQISDE
jgi:hypothetical protein